jgi:hypothetical protein
MSTFAVLSKAPEASAAIEKFRCITDFFLTSTSEVYEPAAAVRREAGGLSLFWVMSESEREVHSATGDETVLLLGTPIPEQPVLQAIPALGEGQPFPFDGIGAIVVCGNDSVTLQADKFGVFPIYTSVGPNGLAVSNRAILACALAGNEVEFDLTNLLESIATEGNLGNREPFKHVQRLEGGRVATLLDGGQLDIGKKLHIDIRSSCSADDAIEEMRAIVQNAAKLYGALRCKLTGGFDSRLNLAVIHSTGVDYDCITWNHPCPDSKLASQITGELNLPHVLEPRQNRDLSSCVAITEGCSKRRFVRETTQGVKKRVVSGAGGEFNRLYFLQNRLSQPTHRSISQKKRGLRFLSEKRKSFLTRQQVHCLSGRFDDRLQELMASGCSFYQAIDEVYLDRDRSWFGRSCSRSIVFDLTPLFSERFYQYGRSFTPLERAHSLPHQTLINRLFPGLQKFRFHRNEPKFTSKVLQYTPSAFRVWCWKRQFRSLAKPESLPATIEQSSLVELFSPWQLKVLAGTPIWDKIRDILAAEDYFQEINKLVRQPIQLPSVDSQ